MVGAGKRKRNRMAEHKDKRKEGRTRADHLRSKYEAEGTPLLWFDEIYKQAEGDADLVPWGHLEPRFPLVEWLSRQKLPETPLKVLDVGTGFGDNAAVLCKAGFDVTAFDVSPTAVAWAKKRFPDLPVNWVTANLIDPPAVWHQAFDLVSETFTLQALKGEDRQSAIQSLISLVRPGGRLLIVARGRLDDEEFDPPPWPISSSELDRFSELGFTENLRETFFDKKDPPLRHFLAEFTRDAEV